MAIAFEWDEQKDVENQIKHGVSFLEAQDAFLDPKLIITIDRTHSATEQRFYCIGKIERGIVTVRFTYRNGQVRIFGAGFWRKGRRLYAQNQRNT
jgi:uncharacterized DUF497 family protein